MNGEKKTPVRMGILGMGAIGSLYAKLIGSGQVPDMVLTAVTRMHPETAEALKEVLPEEIRIFQEAEDLLEYDNLDAVLVCMPHDLHEPLVLKVLEKGLAVFCDKPLGLTIGACGRMVKKAQETGNLLAVMMNQRTSPRHQWLRDAVQSGRYGALKRVNWIITDWYRTDSYYRSGGWRTSWKRAGGGVLFNQAIHNLDLLQWICGMPSKVQAFCQEGKWHDLPVEDDVTAYFEFPKGATGVFVTSTGDAPGTNRLEISLEKAQILCENGTVKICELEVNERDFCRESPEGFAKPKGTWREVELPEERNAYVKMLENFAEAFLKGTPLTASGEEGCAGVRLADGMYLSSWKKELVDLSYEAGEFERAFWERCEGKDEGH